MKLTPKIAREMLLRVKDYFVNTMYNDDRRMQIEVSEAFDQLLNLLNL